VKKISRLEKEKKSPPPLVGQTLGRSHWGETPLSLGGGLYCTPRCLISISNIKNHCRVEDFFEENAASHGVGKKLHIENFLTEKSKKLQLHQCG
jgi:hypothetical protein